MGVHTKGPVFLHVGKALELRPGLELRCDLARMPFPHQAHLPKHSYVRAGQSQNTSGAVMP